MITKKEIKEIHKFLSEASNPLFLYDDDCDGFCAYLLLKKHYKKGEGMIIKSSPKLDVNAVYSVINAKPDLVVILDKPLVSQEFIDQVRTPIVWLDHHPVQNMNNVNYYNPRKHRSNRPTTYLAYSVVKSNLWIAVIGCVFDHFVPDFISDFMKEYPDLLSQSPKDIDDIKFSGDVGKLIRIFSFNLKGKITDVKDSFKALEKIDSPYEILNQSSDSGKYVYSRYEKLNKDYIELLNYARSQINEDKVFVFKYPSSNTSFTGELSNELIHLYHDKIIVIARLKDDEYRISFRSSKINIRKVLEKALVGIEGYAGGHDHACGGAVKTHNFDRFIENVKVLVSKKK